MSSISLILRLEDDAGVEGTTGTKRFGVGVGGTADSSGWSASNVHVQVQVPVDIRVHAIVIVTIIGSTCWCACIG